MLIENTINSILSRRGYLLKYEEIPASSPEDMYEMKVWIEDNSGRKYDFRNIYIRDCKNPKKKALDLLVDQLIGSYYDNIKENASNRK